MRRRPLTSCDRPLSGHPCPHDRIAPGLEDKITEGMRLSIARVTVTTETVSEVIDYAVEVTEDANMAQGTENVTQSGQEGSKDVTYEIVTVDGKEESRKSVSEEITKQPVAHHVTRGTKAPAPAPAPAAPAKRTVPPGPASASARYRQKEAAPTARCTVPAVLT